MVKHFVLFSFASLLVTLVACSNSAADSNTTASATATTASGVGGGGSGKGGDGGAAATGGHHHAGGKGGSVNSDPGHGGNGGSATTSSNPGTGGNAPSDATTAFEITFVGNPAGSKVDLRTCMGSPVAKGDLRADTEAQFLPWPSQSKTAEPVNGLATWLDLGSAVVNSNGVYSVKTPLVWANEDFRFQCYDWNGGKVTYGCAKPNNKSVSIKDAADAAVSYDIVDNLTDKGFNCQF